jgi:deoxyribonuclease-4
VILGAHTSIAGGLHHALEQGMEMGCDMVQVFSKNQRQWRSPPLTDEAVQTWRDTWRSSPIRQVVCHDSYLINLGHPDDEPWERSVAAFTDELERCGRLGIPFLVFHPGSHLGRLSNEEGCDRVAEALNRCFTALPGCRAVACIENTAGQGRNIGHRFEHLARIIRKVRRKRLVGTCFDTCHAFAAGYALRGESAYEATFAEYDRVVGLHRLKCFHLNDAKQPRGSRVDRHENIGQGRIGAAFFRRLVNDPRFTDHPAAVETPVNTHGGHVGDLQRLRKLLRKPGRR